MFNKDDEEYKKKLKEAQAIRMSAGMITSADNQYDISNQGLTDDYQAKLQRARQIRNFAGMTTARDTETDTNRIKQKMDALWTNNNDTNNIAQDNIINKTENSQVDGKYGLGNIDLTNRPVVKNEDGSISTLRSISFKDDSGKEILIPTVVNGKVVSDDEAIQHYHKTGEYLGKFDTVEQANTYAEQLHKQQEKTYGNYENINNIPEKYATIASYMQNVQNQRNQLYENIKKQNITQEQMLNYSLQKQKEEKDSQNIFEKGGTWIKDFIGTLAVDVKNLGTGIYKSAKEHMKERKEAVNHMENVELKNAGNLNIKNSKPKELLIVDDTIQDITNGNINGAIETVNNFLNSISFGAISKNAIPEVKDFSTLKDTEKYGNYSSDEELTKTLQKNKKEDLLRANLYNTSANQWADAGFKIGMYALLKKAGLGSTASMVTAGALDTYSQTGSYKEVAKNAVSDYVFSKVANSKYINDKLGNKVYTGTKEKLVNALKKHSELIDSTTQAKISNALASAATTATTTGVSSFLANELSAMGNYGVDAYSKENQKNAIINTIITSAIFAGVSGIKGMFAKVETKNAYVKDDVDAQQQLKNYYSIMELDPSKEYTLDEINKQHRILAKKYHPDVNGNANDKMALINNAYDEISNYLKNGTINKVVVKTENTNTAPTKDNIKEQKDGIIVTNDGRVYVDTDSIMETTATNIANSQIQPAITTVVDNNNNLTGFVRVQTIPFEVENSKIPSITPAIYIEENGNINVIDTNSGTKLLTHASSAKTAIETVTKALQSDDEATLMKIKDEVQKNNIKVETAFGQIIDTAKTKLQEDNGIDINENGQIANKEMQTLNYVNNDNNAVETQNSKETNALNMEDRTYTNVGNKNIKPYSEEHPELAQDIKDMAANFMEDLAYSLPGKRYKAGDTWTGQKRSTTKELADFKDATGVSWDKIGEVLNDIYEGKGNYSLAKKMELELDKALSEGYRNIYGQSIMPNEEYLKKKGQIEGKDYLSIDNTSSSLDDEDLKIFGMRKKSTNKVAKSSNIEYNGNSIKLGKKEYANIMSIINTNKPNARGIQSISSADYFYIYNSNGFDDNQIIFKIKIDGNEEFISELRKDFNNGTIKGTKNVNSILQSYWNGRGLNDSNNVSNKRSEQVTSISELSIRNEPKRHTTKQGRSSQESIGNKSDLKNSNENESSFSIRKKEITTIQNKGLTKTEFDNHGKPIALKTAQFFKDSKVRDDNGNLMVMYHGTEANVGIPKEHWFNTFDINKAGNHGTMLGNGFYFTSEKTHAEQYAHTKGNIYEVYLNIKKPLDLKNFSTGDLAYSIRNINPYIEADIYKKDGTIDGYKVREYLIKNGYDGIHSGNTYVAFYSNQIKNINNSNPTTSDDIRYLKKSTTTLKIEKDNLGRNLSKQQQEYFKNSKVRDENGKLKEVYHGTPYDFNIFKYDKLGENTSSLGAGFYFTDKKQTGEEYARDGGNLKQVYLDIEKPMSYGKTTMTKDEYAKFIKAIDIETHGNYLLDYDGIQNALMEYDYGGDDIDLVSAVQSSSGLTWKKTFELLRKTIGYDGIISEKGFLNNDETLYVAFNSNQIKNIDNKTPTGNEDIRYLKKTNNNNPVDENIQKELHNRIQNALLSKNSRKNTFLGIIHEKAVNTIKSLLGVDVSGRKHMLSDYDIRHMIKQHGNSEIEKTKGQIAITLEDIEKIPDIINNYDNLTKGSPNKNVFTKQMQDSIRYSKQYGNNTLYVVEVVPDESGVLNVKTMWKKSIETNKKNNSVSVSHDNNIVPPYTSETKPNSSYSKDSIPQNTENVNPEQYNNYSQQELENMKNSKTIRIANSKDDVINFIETAKKVPNNLKLYFGKVSDKVSSKIKNILGINTDNYNISLKSDTVKHIFKEHGDAEKENLRGQLPITDDDILNIANVINNYDDVHSSGTSDENKPSITFEKNINGNTVVVTYVSDKHHNLEVQTMYKFKNNKGVPSTEANALNALATTSETDSGTETPKNSIPQNTENVNLKSKQKFDLDKSKTNIQRKDSFIEQEIKKAIKNNDIDENIPLTKISDIVYDIEKYIGSDIELKHFRQKAYGIYKTNRDLIRVEEKSDLDTILHEFGHQLDNRLHINKEELYLELVTDDIQHLYADCPEDVQLAEGFAEIIRQYFIQPDIVEKEFPDTIEKINELRGNDKELDEFITKIQKDIYNYIHQTPEKRAKSNISFKEDSKISVNDLKTKGIEKAVTLLFDEDYALKKYTNLLYKLAGYPEAKQISASEDPVIASRLRKGLAGAVDDMVKNGIIDLNTGERKSQGLSAIEDILKDENMTDFMNYLVSLRSIEVAEKELKSGIRYDDAKAVVDKYKNNKNFEKARKIIEQYNNSLLDYAKEAGLYSKADIDLIKQSWLTYVPFQRVIDKGTGKSQRNTANPLKKFRGSDREIINPLEGIIMNTVKIVDVSSKNEVIKRFYNLGEESQYTAGIYDVIPPPVKNVATENLSDFKGYLKRQGVELSDEQLEKAYKIFYPDVRDNPSQLITSFMNNGERIYLQFKDEDLYKIFTGMNRQEINLLQKYIGFANSIFKAGTTGYNMAFAIPNILSDTQQAFVTSEANFIPLYSSIKGVYDALVARGVFKSGTDDGQKMQKIYSLYLQSGASGAGRTSTYRKDIEQQLVDIYKKKYKEFGLKQNSIKQFQEIAGYVSEISEEATRFENFVLELKNNLTNKMSYRNAVESAAISTRRLTQDFAIKGSLSKQINAFVPYFSARLGGYYNAYEKIESTKKNAQNKYWDTYYKNIDGKSEEALKNPETFEKAKEEANKAKMKIIAKPFFAILAILAFNTVRKAVVKDDKNIEELSEQKKMDNYVFPNPLNDNEVITAKKAQGPLKDIINSTEFVQDLLMGNIEEGKIGERFVSLISSILKNNSGVDDFSGLIPPIIKVPLEIATNKDWYFNSEIVKDNDLQNLKPEDQYYEYNTNLSIKFGKLLKKSPAQIDFSIRNIFGQASYDLWSGFSSVFDFFEGNQKADMGASNKFILKRFFANPNNNSESVSDLYDKKEALTVKKNYSEITSKESEQLQNIQNATSIISNINKKIKAIKNDSSLSSQEKGEQIFKLQQQRTDTARQALGKELINSANKTKIESMKFYPSSSTLKNNGYSLTLTDSMKKEYEKIAYDRYKQYKNQGLYNDTYLEKLESTCKDYAKNVIMQQYRNKLVKSK